MRCKVNIISSQAYIVLISMSAPKTTTTITTTTITTTTITTTTITITTTLPIQPLHIFKDKTHTSIASHKLV